MISELDCVITKNLNLYLHWFDICYSLVCGSYCHISNHLTLDISTPWNCTRRSVGSWMHRSLRIVVKCSWNESDWILHMTYQCQVVWNMCLKKGDKYAIIFKSTSHFAFRFPTLIHTFVTFSSYTWICLKMSLTNLCWITSTFQSNVCQYFLEVNYLWLEKVLECNTKIRVFLFFQNEPIYVSSSTSKTWNRPLRLKNDF